MKIENNSEILFLYDARRTNPNGDMDNENKPRMDLETETNLVSDVRLKRYIRDYLELFKGEELFVTDKAKDSKERNKQLKETKINPKELLDVKFFGAVLANKEEGSVKGENVHFTGPIQFNWGYSLNKVELQDTKTITSKFSSGEGIGKDFRVKYSLIAFSGSINAKNAGQLNLLDKDVKLFDEAMVKSIPLSRTRSKIGQTPRLYIRIELKDSNSFLKDLREYLKVDREKYFNSIEEFSIDCIELQKYLELNKENISRIYVFKDDKINLINLDLNKFKTESIEIK
jgi:CRISPR-associated protein Csh2